MISVSNQIRINKPIKVVFNFLSEFENIPLWNYYVKEVKLISIHNGNHRKYRQVRQSDSQIFEVLEEQFPDCIVIRTTDESRIGFKRSFRLRYDHLNNCILEDHFEIDFGFSQIFQLTFKTKIRKSVKENLVKLKELLELGDTVLQDGRVSKLNLQY